MSRNRFQIAFQRLFRRPTKSDSIFVHGALHTPYFIFLRCGGNYSDRELLNQFGLNTYRPTKAPQRFMDYAILANDGEWTLIADDWHYTLWHMPSTRPTLATLGQTFDVFACSVGDSDRSYDFVYYRGSQLVRKFVVADPDYRGGVVVEKFGEPLPGESAAFKKDGELEIVLGIAASLGIKTDYTERDCRVYVSSTAHAPPKPWRKSHSGSG
jgi:hypothetical protein